MNTCCSQSTVCIWPETGCNFPEVEMDVYLLEDTSKPHPAIIIFPGGGYANLAEHEGRPVAERFNKLGFQAFVLKYRIAPAKFPAPMQDAFRAVKLVRHNAAEWNVKPNQVAVCGFSAGGHLCASTGTMFDLIDASAGDTADIQPQRPDAMILCYPVITFEPATGHRISGINLFGEKLGEMDQVMDLCSLVSAKTPPAFIWHTADDSVVPVYSSMMFADAMQKSGRSWGLHVFPHGPHGLGIAPEWPDVSVWPELARDFMRDACKFEC